MFQKDKKKSHPRTLEKVSLGRLFLENPSLLEI